MRKEGRRLKTAQEDDHLSASDLLYGSAKCREGGGACGGGGWEL